MADPLNNLYMIVGLIAGFFIIAFAIWNGSKRFTALEKDSEAARISLLHELKRIESQHLKDVADLVQQVQRQVIERRDDISRTVIASKEDFTNLQKQIETTRSDVKSLLAKIEINDTGVKNNQNASEELREDDAETKRFFADWIQRVEDRIENLRKELISMLIKIHGGGNNL